MSKPLTSVIDGYVRDGLVLCFDGYQPPSGGKWKDLSGSGNDMILGADATFDETTHKASFTGTTSETSAAVTIDAASGLTIEVVGGFSAKSQEWFSSDCEWPNTPKIFLGAGLYIAFKTLNSPNTYADLGGWFMSRDSIDGEMQFAIAGTTSELNGLNNNSEGWDRRPSVAQTEAFLQTNYKLRFGPAFIRSFRIYNRKLTAAELLQNRLLDAKRFNLSTTNIQG